MRYRVTTTIITLLFLFQFSQSYLYKGSHANFFFFFLVGESILSYHVQGYINKQTKDTPALQQCFKFFRTRTIEECNSAPTALRL